MSSTGGTPAAAAAAAAALAAGAAAAVSGGGGVSAPLLPHCPLLLSTFALQQQSGSMIGNFVVGAGGGSTGMLATGTQQQVSLWGSNAGGGVPLGPTQLMAGNAIYSAMHLALMTVPPPAPPLQLLQQGEGATGGDAEEVKESGTDRVRQEEAGELDEATTVDGSSAESYAGKKDEGSPEKDDRGGRRRQAAAKIREAVEDQLVNVAGMLSQLEALRVSVGGAREGDEGGRKEGSCDSNRGSDGGDSTRERTKEANSLDGSSPGEGNGTDAAVQVRRTKGKNEVQQHREQGESTAASRDSSKEGDRGGDNGRTPRRVFTAYDVRRTM